MHYILLLTPPIKDMTTSNAKDVAVTDSGLRKTSKADQRLKKGGSAALSDDADAAKTSKPLKFTGKMIFIKPIIAPQRIKLQKSMVDHTTAMLKTHADIGRRVKTSARFDGKYIDKHDVDAEDAPREKDFIPHSLRTEMPLNCSKTVKKDDRCVNNLCAITTLMEKARERHEQYKIDMSVSA